jgi:alcohol dehydrogenase class IV
MQSYTYDFPTNIRFGIGVSKELPAYLKKHHLWRPLIVTDPTIQSQDFFHELMGLLTKEGIAAEVFYDIHRNPTQSDVVKGLSAYRNSERNAIVGVGGGAALDVAKAIALKVNHPDDLFSYNELGTDDVRVVNEIPHFVAVPTAAGSGSEVGRSTTIAHDVTRQKQVVFSPKLIAKQVFADPVLTMRLSPRVAAATGMDALAHNIEAFLAKGFHPMCDGIALAGISLISSSIEEAVLRPSIEARSKMMIGAIMGAVAFQKGLGIVHCLAHPLSSLLDVHHGTAVAAMLPYGLEYNAPGMTQHFKRLGQAMNLKVDHIQDLIDRIFELNRKLEMPTTISDLGVEEAHLDRLAELAHADFCNSTNPKEVSKEDYRVLYENAMAGID